jgi:hypothetical protein
MTAPAPTGNPSPQPAPAPTPTPAPAPAAPAPSPAPAPQPSPAPAATPKLEDLLGGLGDDARKAVLDEVKRARDDAAKYRTERTTAAQQAQAANAQRDAVLKALGLNPDGSENTDPVQVAEQAQNEAWVAKVSLAIHQSAGRLGADATKLLDSMSFYDSLDQHVTAQPGSPEFASQVDAAITAALTANPAYKAGASIAPTSGTPMATPPAEGAQITEDQLKTMTPAQIVAAQDKGLLRNLLGG